MKIDATLMSADPGSAGAAAAAYEAQGFDGIQSFEGPHDPFLPLALAAQHTTRVELATAIAIAFARNPMVCAYVANDLQLLVARPLPPRPRHADPAAHRAPLQRALVAPNARMREFVRALRAIWRAWETGERLDFRGEFYTHTLMSPFFSPGPNPHGPPPVLLAGFGPAMMAVAGEVADGWIVHPLNSPSYVRAVGLPALTKRSGARRSRPRAASRSACQTIAMIGSTDEEIARARDEGEGADRLLRLDAGLPGDARPSRLGATCNPS